MIKKIFLQTIFCFLISLAFLGKTRAKDFLVYLEKPLGIESLADGRILIADAGGEDWSNNGSKILILTGKNKPEWVYQDGLIFAHEARLLGESRILITDTTNNRVIIVDKKTKKTIWTTEGLKNLHLSYPNSAKMTKEGRILITDRNNNRIIEIDLKGNIFFEYKDLLRPHGGEKLDNGDYLVSDSEHNRVIRINSAGEVIWSYGTGDEKILNWPRDFDQLSNGNYLITDSRNQRVIEVSPEKKIVWQYNKGLYWPYEADRLPNGNTIIADSQQGRVIEVNKDNQLVHVYQIRKKKKFPKKIDNPGFEKLSYFKGDSSRRFLVNGVKVDSNLLVKGKVPSGWTPGVLLAEGKAVLRVVPDAYRGRFAARIDNFSDQVVFWLTKIKVEPGKKYHFSGFIKSKKDNPIGRYEFIWENRLGGFLEEPIFSASPQGNRWKKVEVELKAPKKAAFLNIRASADQKGTVWFDDLELREGHFFDQFNFNYLLGGIIGGIIIVFLKSLIVNRSKK